MLFAGTGVYATGDAIIADVVQQIVDQQRRRAMRRGLAVMPDDVRAGDIAAAARADCPNFGLKVTAGNENQSETGNGTRDLREVLSRPTRGPDPSRDQSPRSDRPDG